MAPRFRLIGMPPQKQHILFLIIGKQNHFSEVLDDVPLRHVLRVSMHIRLKRESALDSQLKGMPNDTSGLRVRSKSCSSSL